MKKKKLGYQETFADYLARFIVGIIIGGVFAFGVLTRFWIETTHEMIWFTLACGAFAAVAWNPFWQLMRWIAKLFTWPRY